MKTILAFAIMVGALIAFGRQCEKTNQAEKETKAIKQDAIRTKAATTFSINRAQGQMSKGEDVDKKRDAMLKSKGDKKNQRKFMDAVRGWHK